MNTNNETVLADTFSTGGASSAQIQALARLVTINDPQTFAARCAGRCQSFRLGTTGDYFVATTPGSAAEAASECVLAAERALYCQPSERLSHAITAAIWLLDALARDSKTAG